MQKFIWVVLGLAVAIAVGYHVAVGPLHIGAPNWYSNPNCPRGSWQHVWWVKSNDPNAPYYYHGYQEIGGCAASITIGIQT